MFSMIRSKERPRSASFVSRRPSRLTNTVVAEVRRERVPFV